MKKIFLVGKNGLGKVSIVDDDIYEKVFMYKWRIADGYVSRFTRASRGISIVKLHQVICGNPGCGMSIDHINGDKLDNRKSNLRICTRWQNKMNSTAYAKNKTGYKGVWKKPNGRFVAQISINGRTKKLGTFDDARLAAIAYNSAAIQTYGEYARLNDVSTTKNS